MKKTYTKKQITEAIAYWQKQLKKLNESDSTSKLSYLKDVLNNASPEMLNEEFAFNLDPSLVEGIVKQTCKALGVDFEANYQKLEDATWGNFNYYYSLEAPELSDRGDGVVVIDGGQNWTDIIKA